MSAWETNNMSAALPDQAPEAAAPAAATHKNPQEYGWVEPTKYDYETYNKSTKEMADAQASSGGDLGDSDDLGVGGFAVGDWASNAAVYTWSDDYGDVVPRFPELEKQLFGSENHVRTGIKFENVRQIEVQQEGAIRIAPIKNFSDAGLHPVMLENIALAGYEVPTPIQQYTIPSVIQGHDLVACAQTGSGKTAAFLIPILSKLMGKAKKLCASRPNPATFVEGQGMGVRAEPLVLIVAPCRELATQIFDEARRFCYRSMLRPAVVYGGGPISEQIRQLEKGCDVLIGTPGRLCDFINRPHLLTLKRLKYMVIDEADEMLNTDWESELKQIMSGGDQEEGNIKYLMFSATFPKVARDLATQHLAHNHVRIHVGRAGSSHQNIKQDIVFIEPHIKKQALMDLLLSAPPARTMIFVNSKRTADEVDDFLFNNHIPCTSIHADRTQREREDSIRAFRSGKTPVLIATGVSARGLDIHKVMHVINYDLPSCQYGGIQEYTHRIGRTGRIGNLGLATSFYNGSRDTDIAEPLVKLMLETKQVIPDFLREFLPEGFTADDEGVISGDFAGLKFEDDDDDAENADNGGDAWGAAESTEAPAAETSAPVDSQSGWAPAPEQTSAPTESFGGYSGPPAPQGQFAPQAPTQSQWGVPSAPAQTPPASQFGGHAAPPYGGQSQGYGGPPPFGGQPQGYGGPPPAAYQPYGGPPPAGQYAPPAFGGQGLQYGQSQGYGGPPPTHSYGGPPPANQYAPSGGPPAAAPQKPAGNGWGAPAPVSAPVQAAPAANAWNSGSTW
ncbi:hypothetical protein VTL71DRAFT_3130 [Oculimacula yallundae]|uniref:RNA helicase n=1 Tax=Oculimacula yallundae TaxID=86028 RepID=A0ABR4C687_9HELO